MYYSVHTRRQTEAIFNILSWNWNRRKLFSKKCWNGKGEKFPHFSFHFFSLRELYFILDLTLYGAAVACSVAIRQTECLPCFKGVDIKKFFRCSLCMRNSLLSTFFLPTFVWRRVVVVVGRCSANIKWAPFSIRNCTHSFAGQENSLRLIESSRVCTGWFTNDAIK